MIFERKIYNKFLAWKVESGGNKALLVEGARRIGKSTVVEEFAKQEYKSYILIDFAKASEDVKSYFHLHLNDLDTFYMLLSVQYGVELQPRESLIIFDEVQLFPKAREAIKYLVADGRYHFIETGSLMSIKANVDGIVIPSEERHLSMYPFDFEEFLWAIGNETLFPLIRKCFLAQKPLGQAMHRIAMDYFRQYLLIGGMPQAINEYVKERDFIKVDTVKRNILTLYRSDIIKHAKGYERKVEAIFDEIPSQLQRHEKTFRLASLDKKARFRDYEDAMFWLDDAMIINPAYNSTEPSIGLKMNMDRTTIKCYMADTGLLISHAFDERSMTSEDIYQKLLFGTLEFNEGMIIENMVAQMLVAAGHKLYFYSKSDRENSENNMEIDFLIAKNKITSRHNISPLEVKSGKNYTFSSLKKFCKKYDQQLNKPFLLHNGDVMEKDGFTCLPLYMTPML